VRLSLLRSPVWPDPEADRGRHSFTYALYPHAGGWRGGRTMQAAYELNYRLVPVVVAAHPGPLPPVHSFVAVEAEGVILNALKKAEDDDALIARLYEFAGREASVRLRLPRPLARAAEVDLQEKETSALTPSGAEVTVRVRPYEIKSLKLAFAPRDPRDEPPLSGQSRAWLCLSSSSRSASTGRAEAKRSPWRAVQRSASRNAR
jgi:alpha-mannosidase